MADRTEVNPFEVEFADDYPPVKKREPVGIFKRALGKIKPPEETSVDLSEVMTPEQLEEERQAQAELEHLPDIDVPEIETHVESLPEENENEKELVVEHKDDGLAEAQEIAQDRLRGYQVPPNWNDMSYEEKRKNVGDWLYQNTGNALPDELDVTQANELLGQTNEEQPKEETSGDKTLTPMEKEDADMNELRALAQNDLEGFRYDQNMDKWTPKQKQDAIKAWKDNQPKAEETKEEPPTKEEPSKKTMTKEEALAEARMLAQDDLEGFDMSDPEGWSQLSTKDKQDIINNFLHKNDTNDNVTNVDEDTTNNYEAYKRYPTGLRLAEDAMQGVDNIVGRASNAARENLAGGTSINDAVKRAAIPHYDYRSFLK